MALRRIATALLAAGLIVAQAAHAQVTLNFVNADIDQVAKAIGAATGKTIIVDPRVKGQLNLVSENPVPEDQALKTLQASLRMQGFALVQDHGVLKVVPEADAKLQGVPTYVGNSPAARGDQVITQVFQLRNESANNILPVLRPLISPNNTIAAYPGNNTLVVTDYADNVRRIAGIIAGIDTAAGREVDLVQLKNANAIDVADQMNKLLDPGTIGSTDATLKVVVTADPRTNSLMFRASSSARLEAAKTLAKKLDSPTSQPGNMHVVALRNADATRLARTLRGMMGKGNGSSNDNSSSNSNSNSSNSFGQSGGLGNSSNSTGTSGVPPLPGGFGGNSSSGSGSNPMSGSGGNRDSGFSSNKDSDNGNDSGGGMIQADSATNSLIITAADPVYRNLRAVIDQLDARRAQVYIEALIVELSATTGANLGIQWQGLLLSNGGNNAVYGSTSFGSGNTNIFDLTVQGAAVAQNTSAITASTGLLANGLNIGLLHRFGNLFGLGGLLQALSTSADANILSTPNLITLDNEEAKIVVGQNVPVVTGSYATPTANAATSVTAFNTFDRRDVGVTLHVKPQITDGGVLKMQIYQEDSSVDATTKTDPGGVTINTRSVQSTILADDGEIVVLGGLMQDQYNNNNSKIPLLGDIPFIGSLFRSESKTRTKTNLMVFLRPVIVRDQATASQIANTRYDYMRQQQYGSTTDNRLIRDQNVPVMPPKPLGPSEGGGAPAQNLLDWSNLTRGTPSTTLPQDPNAGPAPQPYQQAPQRSELPQPQQPPYGNAPTNYAVPNNQPSTTPLDNSSNNSNSSSGARP
ncbi:MULTISPECIES: type II secretion system secretin GspD [unclassified Caballeronia]|uniref:type II secretion system secretin GspD n=1 Tax=unclassified Caballeronia TaxID=2646786 RepID=UPI0020280FB5|nr:MULTISPECIES: type II secretion system secretin GspD [unclassified Caballeronia]MDR5772979.1 type II secretion system secretin GspD [Caballeronia sp. LZ002]MDR5848413.1 type II secretion system secretin GspD [Caballeronia sp. LZ003]